MTTMRRGQIQNFFAMLLILVSIAANAHAPEEKAVSLHGGIAYTADYYNLELEIVNGGLSLHVRDRKNRPLDVEGAYAAAFVWGLERSEEVMLRPATANRLEGQFKPQAIKRVIVTLHVPGREPLKAWFTEAMIESSEAAAR